MFRIDDETLVELGGTQDSEALLIGIPLEQAGRFLVQSRLAAIPAPVTALSALRLTPRVLSHSGGVGDPRLAVSFTLREPAPVTVGVYNRAGRLVRRVASGDMMSMGSNLVYWDGQDEEGHPAEDGLYMIAVEALGERSVKTAAVVR